MKLRYIYLLLITCVFLNISCQQKKEVVIRVTGMENPRVQYGYDRLADVLKSQDYTIYTDIVSAPSGCYHLSVGLGTDLEDDSPVRTKLSGDESFCIEGSGGKYIVAGYDASGVLYGCLELGEIIKREGKLPKTVSFADSPKMKLRGTCIGMQKTYVLPEYGQYNYPYTPELFPFFYDKELWIKYLDMLVEDRFNSLYLWSGHPFSSLVKPDDYPYAVDVDKETLKKNQDIFSFITHEANRRGIWVIQKFYNIHVGKNFAKHNHIATHASNPTPLLEDYTKESIAAFVRQYPNVGLLVCLGEALRPVSNDIYWLNKVIIPGVKEGLEQMGAKTEAPLIIRGHNTDPPEVIEAALPLYGNLYTMSKYNGEALTTYHPRGPWAETHRELAGLGSTHIDNVHILANLEPFRWSSPDFIYKSVQAMHQIHGANGLHLYPESAYWDWPYTADKTNPRLYQADRDWMWYKAWGRYAWNDERDSVAEKEYWVDLLEKYYGCSGHGEFILTALQESGECAPKGLRRFGITNGNRQCYSLGMFMLQLIDRKQFRPWVELWRSDSPEGEGLEEYVDNEIKGIAHSGETPPQIAGEIKAHGEKAVKAIEKVASLIDENKEEFDRLRNDIHCTSLLANFYSYKSKAAEYVLRYKYNKNMQELDSALVWLEKSIQEYRLLTNRTKDSYLYAASLHDKVRKIPVSGADGKNVHWTDVLPLYEKELETFKMNLTKLKKDGVVYKGDNPSGSLIFKPVPFKLLSEGMEKYTLKRGASVFKDDRITIENLSDELTGLTGIRFSETEAINIETKLKFQVNKQACILIGYFNTNQNGFLQKPNLETDAYANERGGLDPVLRDAVSFKAAMKNGLKSNLVYPDVDIHAYRFEAGTNEMIFEKGRFLILGVIDGNANWKTNAKQVDADGQSVNWLFE